MCIRCTKKSRKLMKKVHKILHIYKIKVNKNITEKKHF